MASEKLPIMEHFYTLQGEGAYAGHAAYFVRLGGCDVGCHWCDVKESWDADAHPKMSVDEIIIEIKKSKTELVVITGGEPLMYDLTELTSAIKEEGLRTHIETSGAYPLTGHWDWVTLSPKKFKSALPEVFQAAQELKVIVYNQSDFKWAEEQAVKVNASCLWYLQSEWDKQAVNYTKIIDYIKERPKWHLSVQTHKYLKIP